MKSILKLLLTGVVLGLFFFIMWPKWRSLEEMGERRFEALQRPAKEILVGVSWPFAMAQDGMADGLQLALDEINTENKAANRVPLRLIMRDDENKWSKAKNIALEFANNPEMSAVIGYYGNSIAMRASAIYEPSRLLHFIAGATSAALTEYGNPYIIHTILPSDKIANLLALSPPVGSESRKFAVIWEGDDYSEDLAYQYRVAQDSLGGEMIYEWSYPREQIDFRLPVNQLKTLEANSIFFAGQESAAAQFLRTAQEANLKLPILGAYGDTPGIRQKASNALEGSMFLSFYDVASARPENQEFVRKFRARYGKDPDVWAAQGYDALHLFANALRSSGSRNPLDLAFAIRFMPPWNGVSGRYKFNAQGKLSEKPLLIKQFKNGLPVTVKETIPKD